MSQENKNLITNYSSAKYSWLKSGGKISHLYKIYRQNDLIDLFDESNTREKSFLVIGNLSNTLIKDEGFNGIAIKLSGDFTNIQIKKEYMLVGAAVLDSYLSRFCYQNAISGYEFLYTIPGSIGGNIFMNAGCYNQEIKDKLISVIFFDIEHKKIIEKKINELNFDYRQGFQKKNTIILYGKFKITQSEEKFDPDDEDAQYELRKQAGVTLAAWLNRYRGSAENIGLDLTSVEYIVRVLRDDRDEKLEAG